MSKLQNQDFKTEAQLTGAGAAKSDLLNDTKVYVTANGINKRLDEAITDGDIGAGGSGGINYISNPDAEDNTTTGYVTYSDTPGLAPIDGVGGTANITFATTASTPLRGSYSFLLTKDAANRQGEGVSIPFTINEADKAQVQRVSFDFSTSANYMDGMIRVYVYDITNSRLIEVIDRDLFASSGNKFVGTFQTSSDSVSYRLIFHISTSTTTAWTLKFDNLIVGPQTLIKGPIVTDWQFAGNTIITGSTTNPTKGSTSLDKVWTRRVGDSLEVRVEYVQTTAGTAGSGDYFLTIPNNLKIDLLKITSDTAIEGGGNGFTLNNHIGTFNANTGNNNGQMHVFVHDETRVRAGGISSDNASGNSIGVWGSGWYNLGDADTNYTMNFKVPIQGWSSNVVLSEDVGNRLIITNVRPSSNQTPGANNPIPMSNIEVDKTSSWNGSQFVSPESGDFVVSGAFQTTATASASMYIARNGTLFKIVGNTNINTHSNPFATIIVPMTKGQTLDLRSDGSFTFTTNTYLNISKLFSPQTIAASETVAVRAVQSSGQSIPNATETTVVWNTSKSFDTHNALNASNGIFTSPQSAYYRIEGKISFNGNAAGSRFGYIRGPFNNYQSIAATAAFTPNSIAGYYLVFLDTVYVPKGEQLFLTAYQDSGSALSLTSNAQQNYITITKVGN